MILVAWAIELLNPPKAVRADLITPLVLITFIAFLFARCRAGPDDRMARPTAARSRHERPAAAGD
jgi:hypothetical protein